MARSTPKRGKKAAKASQSVKAGPPLPKAEQLERDKSHVGRRVSKDFDGDVYDGTVTNFVQKHRLWKIRYDDGDGEEMDWTDLSAALELHEGKNKKKGKKAAKAKGKKSPAAKPKPAPARAKDASPPQDEKPAKPTPDPSPAAAAPAAEKAEGPTEAAAEEDEVMKDDAEKAPAEPPADDDSVMDIGREEGGEKEGDKKTDAGEGEASKPPARVESAADEKDAAPAASEASAVAPPEISPPSERLFGKTARPIVADVSLFSRNPCRLPGGISRSPEDYPNHARGTGSFGFLIQRLSDRNYAMRALCLDGAGAQYNTYRKEDVSYISVVWYPPTNLEDHASDAAIVDGCHLDLIDPETGKTFLTGPKLETAILNAKEPAQCVFLNGAESNRHSVISADDIACALLKCKDSLLCVSLTECKVNANLLGALASCPKLQGLIIENCQLWGSADDRPTDSGLAAVLRSCPDLKWCFVKSSLFGGECWRALAAEGGCPSLEVLWVDAPAHTEDRAYVARGDRTTIRAALEKRAGTLRLCMVNPDDKNESRYVIGGGEGTDRLEGRERTEDEKMAMRMYKEREKSYVHTV